MINKDKMPKNKNKMYCGNNAEYARQKNLAIGNRYKCMKKGIGVGLHLPLNDAYEYKYDPIDTTKVYCGTKHLPNGYDRLGNNPECFRKGVGVGMLKKWNSRGEDEDYGFGVRRRMNVSPIILILLLGTGSLSLLYYFKVKNKVVKVILLILSIILLALFLYFLLPYINPLK